MKRPSRRQQAFTLIELVVVIATLALLTAMMLPALASSKTRSQRINCMNNLKQVGMSFRLWENEHGYRYPMAVSYLSGGASEYLSHSSGNGTTGNSGSGTGGGAAYLPQMAFMVMSNELGSTKILYCPADNIHAAATNFTYQNFVGNGITAVPVVGPISTAQIIPAGCSYFVGADATEADPQSIISGDCNIGNFGTQGGAAAGSRIASTSGNSVQNAQAITSVSFSFASSSWAWTAYDLHQKSGNLLIADGSVQTVTISGLKVCLNNATNVVPGPVVNFIW